MYGGVLYYTCCPLSLSHLVLLLFSPSKTKFEVSSLTSTETGSRMNKHSLS